MKHRLWPKEGVRINMSINFLPLKPKKHGSHDFWLECAICCWKDNDKNYMIFLFQLFFKTIFEGVASFKYPKQNVSQFRKSILELLWILAILMQNTWRIMYYIRREEVVTPPMSKLCEFMMSIMQDCDLISMQMHSPPSFLGAFSYIHELELVDSY
jgi:hypothetical protein